MQLHLPQTWAENVWKLRRTFSQATSRLSCTLYSSMRRLEQKVCQRGTPREDRLDSVSREKQKTQLGIAARISGNA